MHTTLAYTCANFEASSSKCLDVDLPYVFIFGLQLLLPLL
jgi:hypothetical protein